MCNCIDQAEKEVLELMQQSCDSRTVIIEGSLYPVCITYENDPPEISLRTKSVFKYTYQSSKKDGRKYPVRHKEHHIIHYYCPFCGEKYPE